MSIATMPRDAKTPAKKYASIKVEEEIVKRFRLIAARQERSIADVVSDILRPISERQYQQFKKDIASEA